MAIRKPACRLPEYFKLLQEVSLDKWFRFWGSSKGEASQRDARLRVVSDNPATRRRMYLLVVALVFGTGISGFYIGVSFAWRELGILRTDLISTKAENSEYLEELDGLRRRVAILDRGSQVSRDAAEEVRLDIVKMREDKSRLTRELSFFRSLMDPARADDGVNVQSLELLPTSDPRRFQWKLIVVQNAKQHRLQKGTLQARVDGYKGGQKVSYALADLSKQFDRSSAELGFRYFQSVPGDGLWGMLTLPGDFEPEAMEVTVSLVSPVRKVTKKTFEWLAEESE